MASELSTPVDVVEAWPVQRFLAYHAAAVRLIRAKNGQTTHEARPPEKSVAAAADKLFDEIAARKRIDGNA